MKKSSSSVCKVTIDASASLGYYDDAWLAIPVTFQDYRKDTNIGFAISSTNAQVNVDYCKPKQENDVEIRIYEQL